MAKKKKNERLTMEAKFDIVIADKRDGLSLKSRKAIEATHGVCIHYQRRCQRRKPQWFQDVHRIINYIRRLQRQDWKNK